MGTWFWDRLKELDQILRGEKTRISALREGSIDIPLGGMSVLIVVLGWVSGACMGSFALLHREGPVYGQLVASTLKVPALFLLTLLVTFPSLYVFNALVGSRFLLPAVLKLLVASLCVTLAMLAGLGPIVAFFSVSTESYPFMVLLNVLVFAVSGSLGLVFLLQTLHRLTVADDGAPPPRSSTSLLPTPGEGSSPRPGEESQEITEFHPEGPLDALEGHVLGGQVKVVFRCWMIVYGLVGAQMGWILRPFIGNPDQPFTWFRARESNFFESVWHAITLLFQ